MIKSKIIDVLKSFNSEEIRKFSEFLHSPFHNKNKKAVILFEIISKYYPDFNDKDLSKEILFIKLFEEKKEKIIYDDPLIRNLLSDLLLLSEKFLAHLNLENDNFLLNEGILKELNSRNLRAVFEKKLKSVEDKFLSSEFGGEEDFYRKFLIEELKSTSGQFSDELKLYNTKYLLNASEYISYFYLIKVFKMKVFFEWQKQFNLKSDTDITDKIIKGIDENEFLIQVKNRSQVYHKILTVYFRMYSALCNPHSDELYFEFKKHLTQSGHLFSQLELYGLYICLTNSCTQKIDIGKSEFHKESFSVYRDMFSKDLFDCYPGFFSMTTFTAILLTGINSEEYALTEKLLNECSQRLNPLHKQDALNFSNALINFSRKDFSKALEYAGITSTEFTSFKYHLKIISLKSLFELSDYESLYYMSDSFEHFLSNNKLVSSRYKSEFKKFIRMLDLLVKLKTENEDKHFERLKMFLKDNSFTGKKWIQEKLDEIISSGNKKNFT